MLDLAKKVRACLLFIALQCSEGGSGVAKVFVIRSDGVWCVFEGDSHEGEGWGML